MWDRGFTSPSRLALPSLYVQDRREVHTWILPLSDIYTCYRIRAIDLVMMDRRIQVHRYVVVTGPSVSVQFMAISVFKIRIPRLNHS